MTPSDQAKIIILETNQEQRNYLRSIISGWGYLPFSFEKETTCLDNLQLLNPDLIISGPLSLERTFRLINTIKMINSCLPVLIITDNHGINDFITVNGFTDVLAVQVGLKPSEIKEAISNIRSTNLINKNLDDFPLIVGQNTAMVKIKKMIPELSRSKESVLIQGETGTGKELVARAIHFRSERRENPFIKVNTKVCAGELFEKNLIGACAKAFKKIDENKEKKFDAARTGTIFFNEIDRIPPHFQANLLDVLEKGGISSYGDLKDEPLDIRIIAATSTNLDLRVEKGKFRKDLYYRLNIIGIHIPPLRHRIDDISLLTDFFVDKFCNELGKSYYGLSLKTKGILSRYYWPGNVKEFKNVIKSSVSLGNEDNIISNFYMYNQTHTPRALADLYKNIDTIPIFPDFKNYLNTKDLSRISLKAICSDFVKQTEEKVIAKALETTGWNRKKAAILLNISYKSLLNKIKAYNLT